MLTIEFRGQHPYTTWAVAIRPAPNFREPASAGERARAAAIMAAFTRAGWSVETYAEDTGWPSWDAYRDGSDLFGEWTKAEQKKYMAEARKILRKFGLTKVPRHRMTLAELL